MKADKIYLVGFMAAGKSTVAAALSDILGWELEDTDSLIEARDGRTVASIFKEENESYFRQIERIVLQNLSPRQRVVVATGGGTFADATNRSTINSNGVSVWLDVSFDTVLERIPDDGRRPLATNPIAMHKLWNVRRSAYRQAHIQLKADQNSVEALVKQIIDRLDIA